MPLAYLTLTTELHPHGVWLLYDYTGVSMFYQASVVIKLKFVYAVFAVFQATDTHVAFSRQVVGIGIESMMDATV